MIVGNERKILILAFLGWSCIACNLVIVSAFVFQNVCRSLYGTIHRHASDRPDTIEAPAVDHEGPTSRLRRGLRPACWPGRASNPLRYALASVFFQPPPTTQEPPTTQQHGLLPWHFYQKYWQRLVLKFPKSVPPVWVRRFLEVRLARYYAIGVAQRVPLARRRSQTIELDFLARTGAVEEDLHGAAEVSGNASGTWTTGTASGADDGVLLEEGGQGAGRSGTLQHAGTLQHDHGAARLLRRVLGASFAEETVASACGAAGCRNTSPNFQLAAVGHVLYATEQRFGSWRHPAFCLRDISRWLDFRKDWVWAAGVVESAPSDDVSAESLLVLAERRCEAQQGTLYEARGAVSGPGGRSTDDHPDDARAVRRVTFVFCAPASCEREIAHREIAEFAIRYQLFRELFDDEALLGEGYFYPTPPRGPPATDTEDSSWYETAMASAKSDYAGLSVVLHLVRPVVVALADFSPSRRGPGPHDSVPVDPVWKLLVGEGPLRVLEKVSAGVGPPQRGGPRSGSGEKKISWPSLPIHSLESAFSQLAFPYCMHLPGLFPVGEKAWNMPEFMFQGFLAGNGMTRQQFLEGLLAQYLRCVRNLTPFTFGFPVYHREEIKFMCPAENDPCSVCGGELCVL